MANLFELNKVKGSDMCNEHGNVVETLKYFAKYWKAKADNELDPFWKAEYLEKSLNFHKELNQVLKDQQEVLKEISNGRI